MVYPEWVSSLQYKKTHLQMTHSDTNKKFMIVTPRTKWFAAVGVIAAALPTAALQH